MDATPKDRFANLSDGEVLSDISQRFEMLYKMGVGACNGAVRGLIVSGAPGVGKSYTIEFLLSQMGDKNSNFRYNVVKGSITGVNLYKMLYRYRDENCVLVLDDTDSIFFDDEGIALLKAALDSGDHRKLCWLSESASLRAEGIDSEFEYHGSVIFITNTDFQKYIDNRESRLVPHFEALISRSIYLDLKIHSRRAIALWAEVIVRKQKVLQHKMGLKDEQVNQACDYINRNRDDLRTLSIREYLKVGSFIKSAPEDWERMANMVLLRQTI